MSQCGRTRTLMSTQRSRLFAVLSYFWNRRSFQRKMPTLLLLLLHSLVLVAALHLSPIIPPLAAPHPTASRSAAADALLVQSPAPSPSDPRVCLTNILMTYFRCKLQHSQTQSHALAHTLARHTLPANTIRTYCGPNQITPLRGGSVATASKSFAATVWLASTCLSTCCHH